ncbi:GPI-anchored surface protein, putative [Bodo saltans]|uniref:GPI-anchored surface protein, putative n=1 Tax=Bodo saltans TaxID=75058 RepID=A0A0S4IKX6_BODSA|nr:GPI-anchored surface protein, putative [Bodo saltans]|eukprot:CUF16147.1 GPI-anchored surface protein, putative [Bodo saltans]
MSTSGPQHQHHGALLSTAPFATFGSAVVSSSSASSQQQMPPISLQLQKQHQQNRTNHHHQYSNPSACTEAATSAVGNTIGAAAASQQQCRPAAPDYRVATLEDPIQILANEFQQVHRIGVARYTFRNQQQLVKVGPGTYDVEKGLQLISPASSQWTIASQSPRMGLIMKPHDEQQQDDAKSRRENIKSFHKYFARAILAKQQHQAQQRLTIGSPTGGKRSAALEEAENAAVEAASPRWMRPTSSTTQRRQTIEAHSSLVTKAAAVAPLPMKFAPSSTMTSNSATTDEGTPKEKKRRAAAKTDTAEISAPVPTPPPRPPPPARQHDHKKVVGKKNASAPVVTDDDRLESFRKTLTRPSSATVRYTANAPHWLNGCLRDSSVMGVAVGNPRDGKTDAVYNVATSAAATQLTSPRVSMGTSPRFPGEKPCLPPHKLQPTRPQSARVRGTAEVESIGGVVTPAAAAV